MKKTEQFKKGILPMLILKILSTEKDYGYNIVTKFNQMSDGAIVLKEGTLYPILYRLEDEGLIMSEWNMPSDKSKPKKYYVITSKGRGELNEQWLEWKKIEKVVNDFEKI
jgi:PadR family transcriptional regulator PadR